MRLDDFDFHLPPEQVAQFPAPRRESSRLMVLERRNRSVRTGDFPDLAGYFEPGDVLVVNDTRVIPARLLGKKDSGGHVEVFLVRRLAGDEERWNCLTKSSRPLRSGSRLLLDGGIEALCEGAGEPPYRQLRFFCQGDFLERVEEAGRIPLPPYIRREDCAQDRERYQTVFASRPGAVAAPTAGLHFTGNFLDQLRRQGVEVHSLTLHVGLGTFLPVRTDDIRNHRMHGEEFHLPATTAGAINSAREGGRRVFALGTTVARTLEQAAGAGGRLEGGEGVADLFIYPGYRFKVVDNLITNFHLPKSTLLMLVAALTGRDFLLEAYRQAVAEGFRFFSYGDCMLVV